MSATVEVGYDVRHWVTFEIKDPQPHEIATIERDDDTSMSLLRAMHQADRLTEINEHEEDNADLFAVTSSVIEVAWEAEDVEP